MQKIKGKKSLCLLMLIAVITVISTSIAFSAKDIEMAIEYKGENWDCKNQFNDEWYSNEDEVEFIVDLSKEYEKIPAGTIVSADAPFTIDAEFIDENNKTNSIDEADIIIEEKNPDTAVYVVKIKNSDDEGTLNIAVNILDNSPWGLEQNKKQLNFIVDKVKPVINVISLPKELSTVLAGTNIEFSLDDKNIDLKENVNIEIIKDNVSIPVGQIKENNGVYSIELKESGFYNVSISAKDKAGNSCIIKYDNNDYSGKIAAKFNLLVNEKINMVNESLKQDEKNGFVYLQKGDEMKGYFYSVSKPEVYCVDSNGNKQNALASYDEITGKAEILYSFNDEGQYKIQAEINDGTTILETVLASYIVDNSKPVVTIKYTAKGQEVNSSLDLYDTELKCEVEIYDDNLVYSNGKLDASKNKVTLDGVEKKLDSTGKVTFNAKDGIHEITVYVMDEAGNETTEIREFTVDTEMPELEININNDSKLNQYYVNNNVDFQAQIKDSTLFWGNGHKNALVIIKPDGNSIELKKEDSSYTEDGINIEKWKTDLKTSTIKGSISADKPGKYVFQLTSTDKAGHTSNIIKEVTIDTVEPEISIDSDEELSGILTSNQNVKINISDENLAADTVAVEGTKNGDKLKITLDKSNNKKVTADLGELTEGKYSITIKGTDKSGNQAEKELNFTIDTSKPEVSIDGVANGSHYNNENKTIKFTVNDTTLDVNNTTAVIKLDNEEIKRVSGKQWTVENNNETATYSFEVNKEGDYTLELEAVDTVGNKNTKAKAFVIDREAPAISISGVKNGQCITTDDLAKKLAVSVSEKYWDNDNYKVSFIVNGTSELKFDYAKKIVLAESVLSKAFSKDGEYTLVVNAADKAGNSDKKEISFIIDNTKPEISISGVSNNGIYGENDASSLSIVVKEKNNTTNNISLKITRDGKEYNGGSWEQGDTSSKFTETFEDGHYDVLVKSKDEAGNEASKELSFIVDKTKPELSITGFNSGKLNEQNGYTYYSETQNLQVKIKDNNLKTNKNGNNVDPKITIKRIDGKNSSDVTKAIVGSNSWKYTITKATDENDSIVLNFDFDKALEQGKYEINLSYADLAGNTEKYETIKLIVDSTSPVITLAGVDNNSFNNENKKLSIAVAEENYDTNEVIVEASKNGEAFDIGSIKNTGKQSSLSYNFSEDGLYTVKVTSVDFVGNKAKTEKITFTIDKTNPEISINGVETNEYYNVDKPVTIEVLDNNHKENIITVTRDGAAYNIGNVSVENNMASLSYNFSQEGEYEIKVVSTDKSGNSATSSKKFTIDKTAPVITPKYSGENTKIENGAYINKIFTPSFELDEKEDTIVSVTLNNDSNIAGAVSAVSEGVNKYNVVAADKAGNETTLNIEFTVDVTKPEIKLSGIIEGFFQERMAPKYKITDTNLDASRTSVVLNDAPYESGTLIEADGHYVLKAVATDLANNISEQSIMFTLDGEKPYLQILEPLNGEYYSDRLIPEIIIEDLTDYTIITQTLNGEPYELGDPIEEDGKYVLYLEVKDKAGNISNLSVEFIVDRTAPRFIVTGAEENRKYYNAINLSVGLENPEDTIESILVNGEAVDIKLVNEDGDKVVKLKFDEVNDYTVTLLASDKAGNVNEKQEFVYQIAEKNIFVKIYENKALFVSLIAGAVILLSAAAFAVMKKKKSVVSENDAE